MPATTIFNILMFVFFLSSTALGQDDIECKKFKVSFSSPMKISLDGVFHGGDQIGTVTNADNQQIESNMIDICVDKKHSSEIEKNTVCYISENSIIIYNVWASGTDLPENSTVPGFSSKLSLFLYEIKLLFKSIIA